MNFTTSPTPTRVLRLVVTNGLMDWEQIERHFASHFTSGRGRPAWRGRVRIFV